MFRIRVILLLGFLPMASMCQNLIIEGSASQFSEEKLFLKKLINPFTEQSIIIDTLFIEKDGSFKLETNISTSGWYFIDIGVFNTNVFLTPGAEYKVELPPRVMKSEADMKNPYFSLVRAHLKVNSELHPDKSGTKKIPCELNRKLYEFDTTVFTKNEKLLEARSFGNTYNSDSLILSLEEQFQNDTSSYFMSYRYLRYGLIKINSHDVGLEYLLNNFLGKSSASVNDPAYWELFSKMYDKFLFFYSQTPDGKLIHTSINRSHSISQLLKIMQNHPAIPDRSFAETVVLKEFSDIYYKDYYYKDAILLMLDSLSQHATSEDISAYANSLKEQLTRLKIGTLPPSFSLPDVNNNQMELEDFRGKYTYLIFCTPNDYTCLVEFPFLKALHEVHKQHLSIVCIMVSENMKKVQNFVDSYKYTWTFLYFNQEEQLLKDYDIKAYPTCYLLDKEGRLVQSPATLATEGFEAQLFRIMKSRGDL